MRVSGETDAEMSFPVICRPFGEPRCRRAAAPGGESPRPAAGDVPTGGQRAAVEQRRRFAQRRRAARQMPQHPALHRLGHRELALDSSRASRPRSRSSSGAPIGTAVMARSRLARSGRPTRQRAGAVRPASSSWPASAAALSRCRRVGSSGVASASSMPSGTSGGGGRPRSSPPCSRSAPCRSAQRCSRWVLPQPGSPHTARRRPGQPEGARSSQGAPPPLQGAARKSPRLGRIVRKRQGSWGDGISGLRGQAGGRSVRRPLAQQGRRLAAGRDRAGCAGSGAARSGRARRWSRQPALRA